jgi:hypothetical protein
VARGQQGQPEDPVRHAPRRHRRSRQPILAGNHDVTGNPNNEPFKTWFPTSRAAAQPTFGGRDATGMSEYHTFTAEGRTFLVLALSWDPSDATFAWANQVIKDHPTLPAIVTTHDGLGIASDAVTAVEGEFAPTASATASTGSSGTTRWPTRAVTATSA